MTFWSGVLVASALFRCCLGQCFYTTNLSITATHPVLTSMQKRDDTVRLSVVVNRAPANVTVSVSGQHLHNYTAEANATDCCICTYSQTVKVEDFAIGVYRYNFIATERTVANNSESANVILHIVQYQSEHIHIVGFMILIFIVLLLTISLISICCCLRNVHNRRNKYLSQLEGSTEEQNYYDEKKTDSQNNLRELSI